MQRQPEERVAGRGRWAAVEGRCAFARRGLDAPEMLVCPGFTSVVVSFPSVHRGDHARGGVSCCHLQLGETQRGYVAVCGHPDGPFNEWFPHGAERYARRCSMSAVTSS